ncbi:2-C-methyl-D-erythritol 4-phosphate cytidylyltransferase [Corynebacterium lizhenjunii]|uniref:2-C-methyl-D-erythritol 4-phosphate cytidylyltransferase n=1 Tax=Corynebacterium lizhenjunii TaxID=2709394 RepID=A0A7T0PC94_9CORY|nr:2-C-methyl-D-erythritol 4-phosphate cytidylyltransferase [Corynebacterium lizhenjunii]QPK79467.1 2-C-methyl-D-erythritol 4-phosphate cytidylyltransferase [Corynebacterium lizhenjunii]
MPASPITAVVVAAGQGTRLGAPVPKAFVELEGVSLLARSVGMLCACGLVDEIVVVVHPDMEALARTQLVDAPSTSPSASSPAPVRFVHGGAERVDSVWAALQTINQRGLVLVHDAARALTPPELVARLLQEAHAGAIGVVPVLPVADTIKRLHGSTVLETVDRSQLGAVQTPQVFDAALLYACYQDYYQQRPDFVATDDASLVEWHGHTVTAVRGDSRAFKITNPIDLTLARALLAESAAEVEAKS